MAITALAGAFGALAGAAAALVTADVRTALAGAVAALLLAALLLPALLLAAFVLDPLGLAALGLAALAVRAVGEPAFVRRGAFAGAAGVADALAPFDRRVVRRPVVPSDIDASHLPRRIVLQQRGWRRTGLVNKALTEDEMRVDGPTGASNWQETHRAADVWPCPAPQAPRNPSSCHEIGATRHGGDIERDHHGDQAVGCAEHAGRPHGNRL